MIPYSKFGVKLNFEKTLERKFWRGARAMSFSVLIPTVKINTGPLPVEKPEHLNAGSAFYSAKIKSF